MAEDEVTFGCRVGGWSGFHDWRLIEETDLRWQPWGGGVDVLMEVPARRRWYCARCRAVEETEVPRSGGSVR